MAGRPIRRTLHAFEKENSMTRKSLLSALLLVSLVMVLVAAPLMLGATNPDTITVAESNAENTSLAEVPSTLATPITVASDDCDGCSGGGNGG